MKTILFLTAVLFISNVAFAEVADKINLSVSTCTVTTVADSGPGSLREAINCANADPDYTTIIFNIVGTGRQIIAVETPLPALIYPTMMNGATQPGYNTGTKVPLIQLYNADANLVRAGVTFAKGSEGSEIQGIYITNFSIFCIEVLTTNIIIRNNTLNYLRRSTASGVAGIGFNKSGDNSKVWGNTFGTDETGENKTFNISDGNDVGVYIYTTTSEAIKNIQIGGTAPGQPNKFAYLNNGVVLSGSGLVSGIQVSVNTFTDIVEENLFLNAGTNNNKIGVRNITNKDNLISGIAEPLDNIKLYKTDKRLKDAVAYLGETTADGNGNWSANLTNNTSVFLGTNIVANATDALGNSSLFTAPYTICGSAAPIVENGLSFCGGKKILLGVENLENNVVAYYPFNGNAHDESGNNNDGNARGATLAADRYGNANSAYKIVGKNGEFIQSLIQGIGYFENFSFSYWFKGTDISNALINTFKSGIGNPPINVVTVGTKVGTGIYDGKWHHIAVTWQNRSEQISYLDGDVVDRVLTPNSIMRFDLIMKMACADGYMDDIILIKKTLSPFEVNLLSKKSIWSNTEGILTSGSPIMGIVPSQSGSKNYSAVIEYGATCNLTYNFEYAVPSPVATTIPAGEICKGGMMPLSIGSLSTNILAYFPFNGNGKDESGVNGIGTFKNPKFVTDRFGNTESAVEIIGSTQSFSANVNLQMHMGGFTLSYWFKGTDIKNAASINTWSTVTSGIDEGGVLKHNLGGYVLNMGNGFYDNEWHHFAITWVNNGGITGSQSFLDGVLVDFKATTNGTIGNMSIITLACNNGFMDDVIIYNRNLGASEIRTLASKTHLWSGEGKFSKFQGPIVSAKFVTSTTVSVTGIDVSGCIVDVKKNINVIAPTPIVKQLNTCNGKITPLGFGNLDKNLIAFYSFDNTTQDQSGNSNDGVLANAVFSEDRYAGSQKSLSLISTNNNFTAPIAYDQDLQGFSISYWFKGGIESKNLIHIKRFQNPNPIYLSNSEPNHIGAGVAVAKGSGIQDNKWHHIAFTYWNNGGVFYNTSYVDGAIIDQKGFYNGFMGRPSELVINGENCLLDDVIIYDRALVRNEILLLSRLDYNWEGNPSILSQRGPLVSGQFVDAANITVTGPEVTDCEAIYSFPIKKHDVVLKFLQPTENIYNGCTGQKIILENIASQLYQWKRDGKIMANEILNEITPTIEGKYSVKVIDGNCSVSSKEISLLGNPQIISMPDPVINAGGVANIGIKSASLKFSGSQYATVDEFNWVDGPITIEYWSKVKTSELTQGSAFAIGKIGNYIQSHTPWEDKNLYWDYGNVSGNGRIKVDYAPYLDKWTHVALVSEGKNGIFKAIYLDGKLVASANISDGNTSPITGLDFGVLRNGQSLSYPFKGNIRDFRVWNKVRTAEDITLNMNKQLNGEQENLKGYWKLDEGKGVVLNDGSNSKLNGKLNTAIWEEEKGLTYEWEGLEFKTPEIEISPSASQNYKLTVLNASGCRAHATFSVTVIKPSKNVYSTLKDKEDGSVVNINDGILTFVYLEEYYAKNDVLKYKVYDFRRQAISGLPVLTKNYGSNYFEIDFNSLVTNKNEVYFLEVENGKGDKKVLKFKLVSL